MKYVLIFQNSVVMLILLGARKIPIHELVLCQLGEKTLTLTSVIHINSYFSHITTNAQVFCINVSL